MIVLLALSLVIGFGCIKRVERSGKIEYARFLPLADGDQWQFSGPLGKMLVTGNINDLYTCSFSDSAGKVIFWEDLIKTERGLALKNKIYGGSRRSSVHFEPYLPFAPWSHFVGDTVLFSAAEIRGDSANTHLRIQVEYEIMAVEPVTTPAGNFPDCIKMRMSYKRLYSAREYMPEGNSVWWFAKDVGIVRYSIPEGAGELLKAKIDGRTLP